MQKKKTLTTPKTILCYYPNQIGYIRLLSLFLGSILYSVSPKIFLFFYLINFLGDYLDGIIARKFDQCSSYGALLDCCIDSLGNVIISFFICQKENYKIVNFLIFFFANVDVIQQWYQNLICHKKGIYWKDFDCTFWIVNFYYGNSFFLDVNYFFQHFFLGISVWKNEFGLSTLFNFVYWIFFLGFLFNGVIRLLSVIDCNYKMILEDVKAKNGKSKSE